MTQGRSVKIEIEESIGIDMLIEQWGQCTALFHAQRMK